MAHISLQQLFHKVKKLLAANIFACRDIQFMKRLLNHFFYLAKFKSFATMNNRQANTLATCTTCTSASMRINFNIIRKFEVDNVSDFFYINTTSCYISCYQKLQSLITKLTHNCITLSLR